MFNCAKLASLLLRHLHIVHVYGGGNLSCSHNRHDHFYSLNKYVLRAQTSPRWYASLASPRSPSAASLSVSVMFSDANEGALEEEDAADICDQAKYMFGRSITIIYWKIET